MLEYWKGKRVLVTGHTGFKGSWLTLILCRAGADVTGYALQPPTAPSLFELLKFGTGGGSGNLKMVIGDIRDRVALSKAFEQAQPECVIHLAAQPIVRESYRTPVDTYETNLMGTVNLLECVRQNGQVRSFLNVTTDKVYNNQEWDWGYRETDSLDGFDPYSNSKSCSELATHCYRSSFFADGKTAISTARAGNVIGGGDFAADRIIPDCVRAAMAGERIVVRNPYSIRPSQHVLEPLFAYLDIVEKQDEDPNVAGWYNVGPEEEDCIPTGKLTELFAKAWGDGLRCVSQADPNAPHEANYLKLDCSKIRNRLGWRPTWHIDTAIQKTVEWTRAYLDGGDVRAVASAQIDEFIKMRDR